MPQLRMTATHSPEPGVTLQPGDVFDATDEQAERLLALEGAVEVGDDQESDQSAKDHLARLESDLKDMEAEHKALVDGGEHENVIKLSASRIAEHKREIVKAQDRAGVGTKRGRKPVAPVEPPAPPTP